jgi:hypothetical protein
MTLCDGGRGQSNKGNQRKRRKVNQGQAQKVLHTFPFTSAMLRQNSAALHLSVGFSDENSPARWHSLRG